MFKFSKRRITGDSCSAQIQKQFGRKYYTITFTYDSTAVKFDFGFAARVRIWKDTGGPLDVIFGNGWGRNFLFISFVRNKPITHQMTMRKWLLTLLFKVPLQTVHEPENIWNCNADNKQDSLYQQGFSNKYRERENKRIGFTSTRISVRNRFASFSRINGIITIEP